MAIRQTPGKPPYQGADCRLLGNNNKDLTVRGKLANRDPIYLHTRALFSFARTRAPACAREFFEISVCQFAIRTKTPSL